MSRYDSIEQDDTRAAVDRLEGFCPVSGSAPRPSNLPKRLRIYFPFDRKLLANLIEGNAIPGEFRDLLEGHFRGT
ncbi:MAG: hypothetical protein ACWGNK_03850 [Desulfobacterales bacterium]